MGIEQEKQIAKNEVNATKPTPTEQALVSSITEFVRKIPLIAISYGPASPLRKYLTEVLVAFRQQLTAEILAGEGYDTAQDVEKRQVLSQQLGNAEREKLQLQETNNRLARMNGLLITEIAFLKEELNGVNVQNVSLLYHPNTDEKL